MCAAGAPAEVEPERSGARAAPERSPIRVANVSAAASVAATIHLQLPYRTNVM
jgi:hypothetical protein